ncbi:MAG: Gfo/Idh/MocA family oxidoreductase, partial [Planctomycetales bacterium]|nr:Gfo/Idh/MocA family oxidoreductase [Planctomycetales bacterium]
PTKLVAMADVFGDRLQGSLRSLKGQHGDKFDVPAERQFVGLDAWKKVLETDCDLVILATPPGFRPLHFEGAVAAGKHIFMEKPVATDAPGIRRVLAAGELAQQKGLLVQVGLQRRHEGAYKEVIERIHDGVIGDVVCTRVYWNSGGVWVRPRQEGQTELEYQLRNWYYFNWLCGDHIVEQHIHNLDVGCWVHNDYPVSAHGMGGRQIRTDKQFGQIFDHHAVEYTFANGSKMFSQCQHGQGIWTSVSEYAHGTKGSADVSGGKIFDAKGDLVFQSKGTRGGHQQEHHDLFADIREGKRPNEAEYGAKSTMVAILGRLCTYSGQNIDWQKAISSDVALADFDSLHTFDQEAPVKPLADGSYQVPQPGKEKGIV